MTGDDAVRHCGKCKKNVYNLSEMSSAQVEALLREAETPCVRFYQRHDGTVITGNCPVGARSVRRKQALFGLAAGALAAFGLALVPGGAHVDAPEHAPQPVMGAVPVRVQTVEAEEYGPPAPRVEDEPRPHPPMGKLMRAPDTKP